MSATQTIAEKSRTILDEYQARADGVEAYAERETEHLDDGTMWGKAKQVSTLLTVVTAGLVIILGILVYDQVQSALPAPSNTDLNNASTNATEDFADAMELAPVILIVLIAAVVLAVVQRFR